LNNGNKPLSLRYPRNALIFSGLISGILKSTLTTTNNVKLINNVTHELSIIDVGIRKLTIAFSISRTTRTKVLLNTADIKPDSSINKKIIYIRFAIKT
jgi:rRNA pseudouridine-1189 N-methylase Emg1 (Nep1/Mra1 family)